jgi:hypothetical protein
MNEGNLVGFVVGVISIFLLGLYCKRYWERIINYKKDKNNITLLFFMLNIFIPLISFRYILIMLNIFSMENYHSAIFTWVILSFISNIGLAILVIRTRARRKID